MSNSNDVQRLFLQAVLSRRVLSRKLALKIWGKCIEAVKAADDTLNIAFSDDRNSWDNFISEINESLNPLNLEISQMHEELSGKEMIVLVNRKDDEIAQIATEYSAVEITLFKTVVERIMLAPNESYTVSSLAVLAEVSAMKGNLTKTHAETVLNSLVAKGWLMRSKRGRYSLSSRAMMELQPYLRSTFPDEILECTICMEMVTRGVACSTPRCKTRLHNHCFAKYKRQAQKCPTCNESWSTDASRNKLIPVGEAAFKDGQDQGPRRVRRRATEESDEEEEEGYVDSQLSQPVQSQTKKGKKKAVQEESMDIDEEDATPPPRTQRRTTRR